MRERQTISGLLTYRFVYWEGGEGRGEGGGRRGETVVVKGNNSTFAKKISNLLLRHILMEVGRGKGGNKGDDVGMGI